MVGTMTIITTFLSPYAIRFGWKFVNSLKGKEEEKDDLPPAPSKE
jgi:CPA2 family monovalent cation:H+ antiporter-2